MTYKTEKLCSQRGFTLVELSVVLLIIGLVTAMAMSSGVAVIATARQSATEQKMRAIEKALQAYREGADRLPCPASLTIAEGIANFGVEGATQGTCTGGTPAANFYGTGVTNTSTTSVEGALPVVTLGLPNDYMYDGWGHRFRYAVDKGFTATGAFSAIRSGCSNRAITVNDALGNARSTGAIYAVVSQGENGHGGYTKNGITASTGSTNARELINCHCDNTGATTTSGGVQTINPATYVQAQSSLDPADALKSFDDIVTYKERWQMTASWEKPQSCTQFIYVNDYSNHRVQKLDMDGNFIKGFGAGYNGVAGAIGSSGSADGQLNHPHGLAVDLLGNLWVADSYNFRIVEYDKDGNFVRAFGSQGSGDGQFEQDNHKDIEISAAGYLFVPDFSNSRVQKFNSSGGFTSQFPTDYGTTGMAMTASNIYTLEQETSCAVVKRDSTGAVIASTAYGCGSGPGQFAGTRWDDDFIVLDRDGNLWVSDEGNNRIQKFDSSLTYVTEISGLTRVTGVAIDEAGYIYVSNEDTMRISKFTSAGAPVNSYNGNTVNYFGDAGTANGQFTVPVGLIISNY